MLQAFPTQTVVLHFVPLGFLRRKQRFLLIKAGKFVVRSIAIPFRWLSLQSVFYESEHYQTKVHHITKHTKTCLIFHYISINRFSTSRSTWPKMCFWGIYFLREMVRPYLYIRSPIQNLCFSHSKLFLFHWFCWVEFLFRHDFPETKCQLVLAVLFFGAAVFEKKHRWDWGSDWPVKSFRNFGPPFVEQKSLRRHKGWWKYHEYHKIHELLGDAKRIPPNFCSQTRRKGWYSENSPTFFGGRVSENLVGVFWPQLDDFEGNPGWWNIL